jgi:hypothetical protein
MDKTTAAYLAGVYEMGQVGTSTKEGTTFNQASSKPTRIEMLVRKSGLGECVEFTTKNEKVMYGWELSPNEERELLSNIRPFIELDSKQAQADRWINSEDAKESLKKSAPAKKPAAKPKTRSRAT